MKSEKFKVYLGKLKGEETRVYLEGFSWDCGWYYGGGYITTRHMHTHFNGCFLDTVDDRGHSLGNFVSPWYKGNFPGESKEIGNGASVWEDLAFFLDDPQFTTDEWWRIKDIYKQFYAIQEAAATFQHGGHCTNADRTDGEINKEMAEKLNIHIQDIIIPAAKLALKVV